jgi:hypothetical protein
MAHGDTGLEMIGLPATSRIAESYAWHNPALAWPLNKPAVRRNDPVCLGRQHHAGDPAADQAPIVQYDVSSHGRDRTG